MAIRLITGPANAGKAHVVLDGVHRELAHGAEPLLIVPTRADAEHYLRELAAEGTAMGAQVQRFDGLIEEVVRRAGIRDTALGAVARERLIAAILDRRQGTRASRGHVRALGSLFADLQAQRVTPARLTRALADWAAADGGGSSREELGRLFGEYRKTLARIGRVDVEQRAVRALDELRRNPSLWRGTPVLIYGFDDLTRLQLDAIETLGGVVGARVAVALTYEPGRTAFAGRAATFAALEPLAESHERLGARADYYAANSRQALAHLERSLFEARAGRVEPGGGVRLLEGGGERAELELVAQEIGALLAQGFAPEEIAVAVRAPAAVADLLEEVFSVARIPYALQRRRPLADTALGRALLGLLHCLPAEHGGREGAAPERRGPQDGGPPQGGEEADVGHLLAWLRAPGLLERPELADWLERSARRGGVTSAARARELWEQRHWPLETIDQLAAAARRGPAALIDRAARELQWLFNAPRRGAAQVLSDTGREEAQALAAARRALGELRDLARVAPELAPADGPELARTLERVELLAGEAAGPGAVAVLDPLGLRARRVRALFVCGLQEGVFPARARPEPLLGEDERRRLAAVSGLRVGQHEDVLAAERYLLYAAVSRPEELLVLSWHVCDDDGEPTARSLFVDDVCDLFGDALGERRLRRSLGAVDPPPVAAQGQGGVPGGGWLTDPELLAELRARPWSASSLEGWIGCPVRWFVERVLHPGAFDPEPEPFARGGLAHAALKDTLEGLREETGSARVRPATLRRARALLRAALELREAEYPLSVAPERRPGVRRRLRADLEQYLAYAAELDSPLEPRYLELGFGIAAEDERGEASSLDAFELGPGVRMRGRIDRIDVAAGGELVVYDYKSSTATAQAKWIGENTLQVAWYMLAAEKLLEAEAAGGFYQPLTGSRPRARGVLDADSGVVLDTVRSDALPHEEVRELLGEALAAALGAAGEAARGELQARPRSCAFRGGCQFPTLCRCER